MILTPPCQKKLQLRLNIKCPLLLVGIAFHLYATHNQSKLIADTHTELSIFEGVSAKVSIKGPVKNVLLLFHIMQHFQHEEDKYALYYPSNAPWFDNCVQNPSIKMQIVDFYTATCSLFLEIKQRKVVLKYVCLLPFKAVLGAYFDWIWKWNAL